ncbi:GYF domain-containing protein Ecym_7080 [Eremothecium cymbalariae DBVPG|uniref:GYF domain-containing protein n=1 Tax=Eremothecium cymbalariae (strain CBS 270.75 / DBVPG 7215 / KCTC 17166 / NRRL Y-17582) TaxID=931890 RepID=G8JVR8_ERECY|nr:hypothetical protein Ecym_7080 [Eremothecium cymbalariae DBVPG\
MTPSTPLSSTAATPLTADNVPLSNFQLDHVSSANSVPVQHLQHLQQQSQHPVPPLTASASLPASGPAVATAPPGFGSNFLSSMKFQESEWNYIDQAGQMQGPFTSGMMDSWYTQRFFMHSLQIKISNGRLNPFGMDETVFITLLDLITKVNDFIEPFKKFDIICWQFEQQLCAHEQSHIQSPVASPVSAPLLSLSQPGTTTTTMTTTTTTLAPVRPKVAANIVQCDYSYNELMQLKDSDGGYYRQVSVEIPISKSVKKLSDEEFSIEWDAHNVAITIMREASERDARLKAKSEPENQNQLAEEVLSTTSIEPEQVETPDAKILESGLTEAVNNISKNVNANGLASRHTSTEGLSVISEEKTTTNSQETTTTNSQEITTKNSQEITTTNSQETTAKERVAKREITTKPAPWANKSLVVVEGPSLIEIQKKEEGEKKKREQELLLKGRKQAVKLQQELMKEETTQVSITSVASWASKTKPSEPAKPVKNFDEVYQEQMKEKDFIEEQKRLWEKAQRMYKSQKSTSNVADNEWTTVSAKQTQKKAVPKSVQQPISYASPDKLRAVSSSSNSNRALPRKTSVAAAPGAPVIKQPVPTYGGNASTSARQEFLRWCRSQMKLLPGIEINSVLEMLLSLPAGNESQEIIADTIYSNSSIMDGKRFATEFIKRRIECEKKLVDPLTWSQALSLPEGEQDDWEFQVVGKKKGRRH